MGCAVTYSRSNFSKVPKTINLVLINVLKKIITAIISNWTTPVSHLALDLATAGHFACLYRAQLHHRSADRAQRRCLAVPDTCDRPRPIYSRYRRVGNAGRRLLFAASAGVGCCRGRRCGRRPAGRLAGGSGGTAAPWCALQCGQRRAAAALCRRRRAAAVVADADQPTSRPTDRRRNGGGVCCKVGGAGRRLRSAAVHGRRPSWPPTS